MFMMRFDLRRRDDTTSTAELMRAAVEMAEWSESRGCAFVVLSEHHASPDGYLPSPMLVASAMAARTEQVSIVIAAALLPFYDPIRLAEDMSVLDHLSGGRVSYVFGLGYRPDEFALYDVPMRERGRVAEEKLTQLLAVLRGEPIERDGRVVAVTPAPATPGGPHLSWGGQSPAAARRAARHGLDFVAQSNQDGLEAAYREECERQGRPPGGCMLADPSLPLSTFVARDLDAAWDELGPYLLHDATTYASWNEGDSHTASLSHSDTIEALRAEQGAHRIMTVDEAIDYTRGAGVLALHPLCGGVPPEIAWPYLRRVVDDVMPALTG